MAFAEIQTIRNITGISEDDYSDEVVSDFISMAQKEVLSKVQQLVIREQVLYIDGTRKNQIDGTNTTFYLSKWKGNFLGDMDYDGDIDINDLIVYSVDNDGIETILTPSSIDSIKLSFSLSSAPMNVTMYVTYTYSPFNLSCPDPFISQVTSYLASSYIDITDGGGGASESVRIGNLSISQGATGAGILGNKYYQKYTELMRTLETISTGGAIWGESYVQI